MTPVQIVGNFLNSFFGYLQAKRTAASIAACFDAIEAVNNWLGRTITAIADYDTQEMGAVQYSADAAQQIGHDLEQIQGTHQRYWNRLFDVILPHSLQHAFEYTRQWAIDYFSPPITQLENYVRDLLNRTSRLEGWERDVVDPDLSLLLNFRSDFFRGDQPSINVLIDWLRRPGDFGEWATPPIIGPVVAYLADPAHETTRDNLSRILVDAWTEVPNDIWEAILRWSVTTK